MYPIKIYEVTVNTLDCNGNPDNSATYVFNTKEDQAEFIYALEHYQDLDEVQFSFEENEYFTHTLDNAKVEVKQFLGLEDY